MAGMQPTPEVLSWTSLALLVGSTCACSLIADAPTSISHHGMTNTIRSIVNSLSDMQDSISAIEKCRWPVIAVIQGEKGDCGHCSLPIPQDAACAGDDGCPCRTKQHFELLACPGPAYCMSKVQALPGSRRIVY